MARKDKHAAPLPPPPPGSVREEAAVPDPPPDPTDEPADVPAPQVVELPEVTPILRALTRYPAGVDARTISFEVHQEISAVYQELGLWVQRQCATRTGDKFYLTSHGAYVANHRG